MLNNECCVVCLAWRVAPEEREERTAAEDWLKRESPHAFALRAELIKRYVYMRT